MLQQHTLRSVTSIALVFIARVFVTLAMVCATLPLAGQAAAQDDQPASISGRVFEDFNSDGIANPGSPGLQGVTVSVRNDEDSTVGSAITDAEGRYTIADLAPSDYRVAFELPSPRDFTIQNAGDDDTVDSDPDPVSGVTATITLSPGENVSSIDAGVLPAADTPVAIGNFVFLDEDGDGILDPQEPGVPDVEILLFTASDVLIASLTTDASGRYLFDDLQADTYYLQFIAPPGLGFTAQDAGGSDLADSDVDPATGLTNLVSLPPGFRDITIDAGLVVAESPLGSISGRLFVDVNDNGVEDADEPGVSNTFVTLLRAEGGFAREATPNSTGRFRFDDLEPGSYILKFTSVDELWIPGDDDAPDRPGQRTTGLLQLNPGEQLVFNAGVTTGGRIEGVVFFDDNLNAVGDPSDRIVTSVPVRIRDVNDDVVWEGVTSSSGRYGRNLSLGTYTVEFDEGNDFVFVDKGVTGPGKPSDVDPSTGRTDPITISSGTIASVNAVLQRPSEPSIGLSQTLVDPATVEGDQARLRLRYSIANIGFVDLSNVTLNNDLDAAFAGATVLSVEPIGGCAASAIAGSLTLFAQQLCDATIEVVVTGYTTNTTYLSAATVSATDPNGEMVFDISDDGDIVDADGDRDANELGENDPTPIVIPFADGDVDCDGFADVVDALRVARFDVDVVTDAGQCPTTPNQVFADRGDVNSDGLVDVIDALFIAQCDAFVDNPYCERMNIRP